MNSNWNSLEIKLKIYLKLPIANNIWKELNNYNLKKLTYKTKLMNFIKILMKFINRNNKNFMIKRNSIFKRIQNYKLN